MIEWNQYRESWVSYLTGARSDDLQVRVGYQFYRDVITHPDASKVLIPFMLDASAAATPDSFLAPWFVVRNWFEFAFSQDERNYSERQVMSWLRKHGPDVWRTGVEPSSHNESIGELGSELYEWLAVTWYGQRYPGSV